MSDTNGRTIMITFRSVLLGIVLIGFIAVMIQTILIAATLGRQSADITSHVADSVQRSTQREIEHGLIRNDLQLLAVILTYDQSDRDRVRAALLPQLSPSVRTLIESAERASEEKALLKRGTQRQPDESPDNAARERPRAPRTPRNHVQSP